MYNSYAGTDAHTLATGRTSGCTHTGNRKDIWPVKKLPLKKPLGLQLM